MLKIAERKPVKVKELVEKYAVGPLGIKINTTEADKRVFTAQQGPEPELQEPDSTDLFEDFLPVCISVCMASL